MGSTENNLVRPADLAEGGGLFDQCAWFYALCREYLFRDQTEEISRSLFPSAPAPGTHLLELGCGPGFYACRLAQMHPQISAMGLDLSESLVERARSRAAKRSLGNCSFSRGDAQSLPEMPYPMDAIILSRLLLIVPDKMAVLSEVYRVLRPGGRCFIAEPTSGFRTRIPLSCMRILSRLRGSPAGKYREPLQADVMSHSAFTDLINSQPWASVRIVRDGWYQSAVCVRPLEHQNPAHV
jgi:ubiquinone/menaquinone biosynthesis C-methylase UbiE